MNAAIRLSAMSMLLVLGLGGCMKNCNKEGASAKRVFFVEPVDGATVPSTFAVKFGLEGMKIRPAGEDVMDKTSGHHHMLVDEELGYTPEGQATPADQRHIHYGKGETETTLTLPPGRHKLSMQFANGAHLSYGKEMSHSISVTVEAPAEPTSPPPPAQD
jgi:hypothetical protein